MPMYEYQCGSCGHVFERYSAGRSDAPGVEACPSCGREKAKKKFSTFASSCCSGGASLPSASGGCGGGSSSFS